MLSVFLFLIFINFKLLTYNLNLDCRYVIISYISKLITTSKHTRR
nr:MAG TPA: hypothetical protein [Caudoviricetes sp.]